MPLKTKNDAIERYLNALDFNSDFLFSESKFKSDVDEIGTYLELTYGAKKKQEFLNLIVDNDHERITSRGRMKAFLLSLSNNNSQRSARRKSNANSKRVKSVSDKSKSVFIVHGHDNEAKETVARFVEKLGLKAIVLHEQPNHGRTIIEKFEEFANKISFAIVLLTPDDLGASKLDIKNPKPRARQNVIYELGFFNAKLSRSRVFVLKKGSVEILSDYLGVIYEEMDEKGSWKNKLVGELEEAQIFISPENLKKALLS